MQFHNVCLHSWSYRLPDEIVTSAEIEGRLAPLYQRLRLPEGRLEMLTGIRERRFWPRGTLPSDISIQSGEAAVEAAGIDRREIGALIHGSVCRDHLEPATACRVHHGLGLVSDCLLLDVSNACLGLLNGLLVAANMIELGQIRAALVVGTENARPLVETTIDMLNRETSLTRESIKPAIASLTIGSGSCALLLTDRSLNRGGSPLLGAVARARTEHHELCRSGSDEAGSGMTPLMETDSELLMREGIATGLETFLALRTELGWSPTDIDKTVCHQVGATHRKLLLEQFGLSLANDFATFETLGNTGSVALPISMAMAAEAGHLQPGDHVALMGIGSGINCVMVGLNWQAALVDRQQPEPATGDRHWGPGSPGRAKSQTIS